ncbi:MAG: hypothetical protein AB9834_12970 [Lentimicrobium sp.]
MKKLFLLLFLATGLSASSQVAINTDGSDPDNSAMLDVKSTFKGVLFPRMTSAERIAIASPATGLSVYDLTTQSYWYYNGAAWTTIGNGIWTQNGNDVYANITGNAGIGTTLPEDKLHLYNSTNLRILIETPDNFYAGVRTRNSQREYFMGTIGDRWSVFDNNVGGERISVLPDGNVGIATTTPDPSAALEVSSTTKGFLPPRITTAQRNAIAAPAEGLVIYNTSEKALNVYDGTAWSSMKPAPPCGLPVSISHMVSGGVAPVDKTVTYGTVNAIPGEPTKCWITRNLGADQQASAANDATEASAGWYWQFNRRQGYKHTGAVRTPSDWLGINSGNSDWQAANDPCALELGTGWRIPTLSEWNNVDASGNWNNMYGAFVSALKLHSAGYLYSESGNLGSRGTYGYYWCSSQDSESNAWNLTLGPGESYMSSDYKGYGFSVRCLRDY